MAKNTMSMDINNRVGTDCGSREREAGQRRVKGGSGTTVIE